MQYGILYICTTVRVTKKYSFINNRAFLRSVSAVQISVFKKSFYCACNLTPAKRNFLLKYKVAQLLDRRAVNVKEKLTK